MSAQFPRSFGPYVLLKGLGQGAMGDVCLARPINPRRGVPTPIVVKRLHGELATNPDFVKRFQHEAEVAVSIDSASVAKVYDVGQVGETLYLAMEFVSGWPASRFVEAILNSGRHASVGSVVDLVVGGLQGLGALHDAIHVKTGQPLGMIHRDVSPKNLMIGEDGEMRVIDLGLGKSNIQDWKTRTGLVMGSLGYMPPEQVTAEKLDRRADLYAMGVVLYEMLTLHHYIPRGPVPVMLRNSLAPPFIAPSKRRPDVPTELDAVVERALAHRPEDRFATAADFVAELRRVVPPRKERAVLPLITDLFGSSLIERKTEMERLLAAPLPDDLEPEQEHTIVFVERPGVEPVGQEDFSPTRVATKVQRTARPIIERVADRPNSSDRSREPARTSPEVRALADPALYTPIAASGAISTPSSGGVPLSVVVALVVGAAALAGLGTWFFARSNEAAVIEAVEPEGPVVIEALPAPTPQASEVPAAPQAPAVEAPAAPQPTEVPAAPQAPEASRAANPGRPSESTAPRPRPSAEPTRAPTRAPEPSAPDEISLEGSRSALDALTAEIATLAERAQAAHPEREDEIARLRRSASLAARKSDVAGALKELRAVRATLAQLAGS